MARCNNISTPRTILCIGSLKRTIGIYSRNISGSTFGNTENNQLYALKTTTKADVKTINGFDVFDDVNKAGENGSPTQATVLITMRYKKWLTSEFRLKFENNFYQILRVENINFENKYMKLYCVLKGDENLIGAL